ncbi:long-chain fatty acid--CoA ligase [Thioclava dalianensis]|uniref:Long-chain fatty acid--CoA ligase n=1 Tax=Thioclava dalianensis TaxID=1185766 RepID=A0A074TIB7_9RHOB|nr:long-chain fatty acid--CoA ligase [Thioclava dalianensis]SFM78751.1 fatty-acyl-CoA synthase [Thioclava dalianensis]
MSGTMMWQALTTGSLIADAEKYHAGTEIVSVETDGSLTRSTWREVGAKLVLPGPQLDGESPARLIDAEGETLSFGVPMIWMGLLVRLKATGGKPTSMKRTVVGGSALPPSLIRAFRDQYGVALIHASGMTETSPLGPLNQLLEKRSGLNEDEQAKLREGQGRPPWGMDLRIVDEARAELPRDVATPGELQIRGHWIVDSYFGQDGSALTDDGWFGTCDVATLDADGYMVICDRSKDIIKSGGERISTVELETEVFYDGKVAHRQVPDRVIFVEALPLGATGKVLKNKLHETYGGALMQDA